MSSQLDQIIASGCRITLQGTGFATVMTVSRPARALTTAEGGCYTLHITAATCEQAAEEALKVLGDAVCAS
jgi:hypothetical protein